MISRLILFSVIFTFATVVFAQVSVHEEPMVIPSWEIGPPALHSLSPNPKGPIYPYTLNETLTDRKVDKTYQAVVLENEYVKILILPEIGGRVHGAEDKTNHYVWLYWQRTIKPGLISMTGAWISGGIEWNFPHGHRPSGFMPVDHRIVKHPDGSATVWVGETEPVYRMRWLVGVTLFPGRSYMRCDYVFINPTNYKQPFQFWATAATHANEWAQAQYPGDMVTGHGKHEFWNWPIDHGVDLTWWKNSPNASSYFAFNNPSDWFGTYDHKAQGGMVHVANHNVMPGKKLWTWGSGPSGRIWEDILTEGGGAYFEPQAGAWSDNQPDYHWMAAHQVRTASDYWYPVRDSRGYHNANADFAVNTDVQAGKAFAAVNGTGVFEDLRVVLKDTKRGTVLKDEKIARLAPDKPYTLEVPVGPETTVYDLHLAVFGPKDDLKIELQQQPPKKVELPEGQKDPGDPAKMNQDQLLHSGEWLDKFVRIEDALPYYKAALKKDPGDSRVNTEMGFLALREGRWKDALAHFDTALKRDDDDSRVYFGRALAFLGLRDFAKAREQFYRASYGYEYFAPAYVNLMRLDLAEGNYRAAIEKAIEAESQNGKFADVQALKAVAYRHLNEPDKALASAERALELDPMHFMGGFEKLQTAAASGDGWKQTWTAIMRDAVQNYLELACSYAEAGLYAEADQVLASQSEGKSDSGVYPMVYYLRGYFSGLEGQKDAAVEFYGKAAKGPARYTNPHRMEEKLALEAALSAFPADAHAHLFLGNLLYYELGQREEGLKHWREAVKMDKSDPGLSLAWRNVGYAEKQVNKNLKAAEQAYQQAIAADPQDARALLELDQIKESLPVPPAGRLKLLTSLIKTVELRDDLTARLIDLRLLEGDPDDLKLAYDALKTRHFHTWEGSYGIHHAWVEVNQKLGDLALRDNSLENAKTYYEQASAYPPNLEVAPRTPDFRAHVNWNFVKLYQALKQDQQAHKYLQAILAEKYQQPHLGTYYQGLAQKALGNEAEYQKLLDQLQKRAASYTSGGFEYRGRKATVGHYLMSLVLQEHGDKAGADRELKKALSENPQARRLAITEAQLDVASAHQ